MRLAQHWFCPDRDLRMLECESRMSCDTMADFDGECFTCHLRRNA